MNTFEMKTAIHFGDNALDRLKEIPYKRVLIITDPFVVQSKMIDLITVPLNSAGIEYDIFHDVVPDAPVDKIAVGVKKFLEYQPEAVVAVGGGSAIDSSKAIREFALKKPVSRMLVNTSGALGGIGLTTNLAPTLMLSTGTVGGGFTADNISPLNLINIRKVGYGVRSFDQVLSWNTLAKQESNTCINRVFDNYDNEFLYNALLSKLKK